MIRIKVYKLSQIIKAAVIAVLVIAAIITGIIVAVGGKKETQLPENCEASVQFDASLFADKFYLERQERMLASQLPLVPDAVPVTAETEQSDEPDD